MSKRQEVGEAPDKELLNQAEVAVFFGKSVSWCERARWVGDGPPYIKIGRRVMYRKQDLDKWLTAQARRCTR